MRLPDIRPGIERVYDRLKMSRRQQLFAKFFTVGLLMAVGAAGVIAGLPLLGLMIASESVVGVIICSLSVSFGAAFCLAGYLWFTL